MLNQDNLDLVQLKQILETGKHLILETNISMILQISIDSIIEISNAERGLILLFAENGDIIFETARHLNKKDIENPKFEISRSIINNVKLKKNAVYLKDAFDEPEFNSSESALRLKILSVIALPLIHNDEIFGVVYLDNRSIRGAFKKDTFAQEFGEFISAAAFSALEKKKLLNHVEKLEGELRAKYQLEAIIGHDSKMVRLLELVSKIAATSATILIQGESGTGKELIANAIHFNSKRKDKQFLPVNCAALPENLLESELFGHVKGAFTGAIQDKKGIFEHAQNGTIFLDEISEMSMAMQAKLLRILQSGEYSKVGSTEIKYADVRLVTASSKNIKGMVKEGEFREDLFYRINVINLELPSLRDRKSDIPVLIEHFLKIFQNQNDKKNLRISKDAEVLLQNYTYPGNVRELENIIQRAVILADDNLIEAVLLPTELQIKSKNNGISLELENVGFKVAKQQAIENFEKEFLRNCLRVSNGNISKAAEIADMHFKNFYAKIQKYNIIPTSFKT